MSVKSSINIIQKVRSEFAAFPSGQASDTDKFVMQDSFVLIVKDGQFTSKSLGILTAASYGNLQQWRGL
jgi:hypothetical protein